MKPVVVKISIDGETRRGVESVYGKSDYATVESVAINIFWRYMGVEYYDPELSIDDDGYKLCRHCGEKAIKQMFIDMNGIHHESREVCQNCGV